MTLAADSLEETAAAATMALRGEIATTDASQKAYIERCPFGVVFGMVSSAAWINELFVANVGWRWVRNKGSLVSERDISPDLIIHAFRYLSDLGSFLGTPLLYSHSGLACNPLWPATPAF